MPGSSVLQAASYCKTYRSAGLGWPKVPGAEFQAAKAKRAPEPRLGPGQSLPILEEESEALGCRVFEATRKNPARCFLAGLAVPFPSAQDGAASHGA